MQSAGGVERVQRRNRGHAEGPEISTPGDYNTRKTTPLGNHNTQIKHLHHYHTTRKTTILGNHTIAGNHN